MTADHIITDKDLRNSTLSSDLSFKHISIPMRFNEVKVGHRDAILQQYVFT